MIREEIQTLLTKTLKEIGLEDVEVQLEHPELLEHGDYSTNVALVAAKQLGRSPVEIAKEVIDKITEKQPPFLSKAEVAGPGFINLFLSEKYLLGELSRVTKEKEKYGRGDSLKGEKVMIEFTDPNPFKEFHIGHLYSNTVGESLSRIFEANGATVKRVNYQGDVGIHVAKAIWGIQKKGVSLSNLEKKSLRERIEFLGSAYTAGNIAFEDDEKAKKEITELNIKIFELNKDVKTLYEKGRKWSLDYFEEIYKRLGTKFDLYYLESEVGAAGTKIVKEGLKKGIFEESEGAVIFPGEKDGLHNRVFINSEGLPTYEAKELGLAPKKYKDFKYDTSIIITGNEVTGYFQVLLAALAKISPELAKKTRHIGHGMVRLTTGKMSSRTGTIITAEQLLGDIKTRVLSLMDSSEHKVPKGEREDVAEQVTVGAVKYALLRVGIGKDIIFDVEKSLSIEGDSGPYLQYTYARCKSILAKAKAPQKVKSVEFSKEETTVLRITYRFEEYIMEAKERLSPNLIVLYATELAQAYNSFYNTNSVLQAEDKQQKEFRLLLTAAVAQLLSNSLFVLGIKAPERM